jgi:hypothetical protein
MNLTEALLAEHSRANCDRIVKWIGKSQERFDELFELFSNGGYRIVQVAAWPLSYAVIAHPELIAKKFPKLLKNLERPDVHNAVKRNTIRLLQDIEIPKLFHGRVMNHCFTFIADSNEKAAVKAFALTVLENLAQQYPDIRQELITTIESRLQFETPAFRSRAKKIMKRYQDQRK